MRPLIRYLRLRSGKRLLLEAVLRLAAARLAVRLLAFRRLARRLGAHMAQSPETLPPEQTEVARRVGWAVRLAARHLPWRCACLEQAVAAQTMLRRRGIPCTLYLGVARESADRLRAHAWLRCGDLILTGRAGRERFAVVSSFSHTILGDS